MVTGKEVPTLPSPPCRFSVPAEQGNWLLSAKPIPPIRSTPAWAGGIRHPNRKRSTAELYPRMGGGNSLDRQACRSLLSHETMGGT